MHGNLADAVTLVLLAGFVAAVVSHRLAYVVVGCGLVALIAALRVLPTSLAFAGFGSELVLLVGAMLVVGAGLTRTGVTDRMVMAVQRLAGPAGARGAERRLLAALVLASALTGAILGDVPAMALWLPAVVQIARHHRTTPGRLLLPILYGVLAGSEVSLIGTAGNILANGLLVAAHRPSFGIFSQAPVGLAAAVLVTLLAVTVGPALVPPLRGPDLADVDFGNLKVYQGEVVVAAHPALDGKRLREATALRDHALRVAAILPAEPADDPPAPASRPATTAPRPRPSGMPVNADTVLHAGDRLLVQGNAEDLLRAQGSGLFALRGEREPAAVTAEALVVPESGLVGRTLAGIGFRQRYGLEVLAVWRHKGRPSKRLQDIRLRAGDILLLSGPRQAAIRLHERLDALLLGEREVPAVLRSKAGIATAILALFVLLAATGAVDPAAAAVGAAGLMVLSGCLRTEDALAALDIPVLLLLAGIVPLGTALQRTPLPGDVAAALQPLAHSHGPLAVWAVLFVVAALTTQFLSDVATALLWVPVALNLALALHLDARPLVLAVMLGGQSPVVAAGHKVALLVPAAGRYTHRDFLRYGVPAVLLFLVAGLVVAPHFFPFHP